MRYRITATYAGAVDPLTEGHLAPLVAWWTRRAPACAPSGSLRGRSTVDITLRADAQNPLDLLFRLSRPLSVPHSLFRLVALYVVEAAWEGHPSPGVSESRRVHRGLRQPARTAPLPSPPRDAPLPSSYLRRRPSATGTLPAGHWRSGYRPPVSEAGLSPACVLPGRHSQRQ
jgi:hypothetical protein